jgi:hypothetical protein
VRRRAHEKTAEAPVPEAFRRFTFSFYMFILVMSSDLLFCFIQPL